MLKIDFNIVSESFEEIANISEERIHYDFLLGNVVWISPEARIEIEWEWIPLLDFAYCMKGIIEHLKDDNASNSQFEFTENSETIDFSRNKEDVKITVSFSPIVIKTSLKELETAINDFHFQVSEYIRRNMLDDIPQVLKKYLLY